MSPEQSHLWQKILEFKLDEPHTVLPFSERLARETGWSLSYTHRAILEYKKFVYLCCIDDEGTSPSYQVDQVWHLHLTYTRSYWIDFCQNTLHKQIHHHPTKGGVEEDVKHQLLYQKTHQLYQQHFGEEPPVDIWDLKTTASVTAGHQPSAITSLLQNLGLNRGEMVIVIMFLTTCGMFIYVSSTFAVLPLVGLGFFLLRIAGRFNGLNNSGNGNNNGDANCGGGHTCDGSGDSDSGGDHGHGGHGCGSGHHDSGGGHGCSSHGCSGSCGGHGH